MKPGVWPLKILISCTDQLENGGEKNPLISTEELARPKAVPSSRVSCVSFSGSVMSCLVYYVFSEENEGP